MTQDLINTILTVVLIPILPVLTAYIIVLLKKKTSEIEEKTNNSTVKKYIEIAENIIETCVTSVSQTYVEAQKKSGTFDKAAQSEAFEMCKQKIISILGDELKSILSSAYGDLNSFIDNKIEYYVNVHKVEKAG